jgi:hypothetical protein
MTTKQTEKFALGRVVITPGAQDALGDRRRELDRLLKRHASGDWGEVYAEDGAANDLAVVEGEDAKHGIARTELTGFLRAGRGTHASEGHNHRN